MTKIDILIASSMFTQLIIESKSLGEAKRIAKKLNHLIGVTVAIENIDKMENRWRSPIQKLFGR